MGGRAMGVDPQRAWDPDEAADMRRRQHGAWVDRVLDRAEWLTKPDRALVESIFRDGRTAVEIAHLTREDPRAVRRRVRRAVNRAMSERLAFVMRSRSGWTSVRRRVADLTIVEGISTRLAAERLGLSYHTVRRHREAIDALFHASRDRHA